MTAFYDSIRDWADSVEKGKHCEWLSTIYSAGIEEGRKEAVEFIKYYATFGKVMDVQCYEWTLGEAIEEARKSEAIERIRQYFIPKDRGEK